MQTATAGSQTVPKAVAPLPYTRRGHHTGQEDRVPMSIQRATDRAVVECTVGRVDVPNGRVWDRDRWITWRDAVPLALRRARAQTMQYTAWGVCGL